MSQPGEPWVDIGYPAGPDGFSFERFEPGAELPLQTFGQGGTHALLAVRCGALGSAAFIRIAVENLESGAEVVQPPTPTPQLLLCRESDVCDRLPIIFTMAGLTEPGQDRNGVEVMVRVEVSNDAGATAEASRRLVLSTAGL